MPKPAQRRKVPKPVAPQRPQKPPKLKKRQVGLKPYPRPKAVVHERLKEAGKHAKEHVGRKLAQRPRILQRQVQRAAPLSQVRVEQVGNHVPKLQPKLVRHHNLPNRQPVRLPQHLPYRQPFEQIRVGDEPALVRRPVCRRIVLQKVRKVKNEQRKPRLQRQQDKHVRHFRLFNLQQRQLRRAVRQQVQKPLARRVHRRNRKLGKQQPFAP